MSSEPGICLNDDAMRLVVGASAQAKMLRNAEVRIEHVLLTLIRDSDSAAPMILSALGVHVADLETRLREACTAGSTLEDAQGYRPLSEAVVKVVWQARRLAVGFGRAHAERELVLLALLSTDEKSAGARLLKEAGVRRDALLVETFRWIPPSNEDGWSVIEAADDDVLHTLLRVRSIAWSRQADVQLDDLFLAAAEGCGPEVRARLVEAGGRFPSTLDKEHPGWAMDRPPRVSRLARLSLERACGRAGRARIDNPHLVLELVAGPAGTRLAGLLSVTPEVVISAINNAAGGKHGGQPGG